MSVNKVLFGGETVVDLTEDTVTPETLAQGYTAHDKSGKQIVGTAQILSPIPYVTDGLAACYDGIWNVGAGAHDSQSVFWSDLSGNGHTGVLANVPEGDTSGWQDNHYLFDMTETCFNLAGNFDLAPGGYTVQIVMEPLRAGYSPVLTSQTDNAATIAVQNTGTAIWYWPTNEKGVVWYDAAPPFFTLYEGKTESGENQKYIYNYAKKQMEAYGGATPGGGPEKLKIGGNCLWGNAKMKLYALRVYNRGLTQEEIELNRQLDKARFGL